MFFFLISLLIINSLCDMQKKIILCLFSNKSTFKLQSSLVATLLHQLRGLAQSAQDHASVIRLVLILNLFNEVIFRRARSFPPTSSGKSGKVYERKKNPRINAHEEDN